MAKSRKAAEQETRAYLLDWAQRRDPASMHEPVTDPTNSGHLHKTNLGVGPQFFYGRIVDAVAFTHCYRVLFERGQTPMPCIPLAQTSLLPFGAREINTYGLGTYVWVLVHAQLEYGLIIGAEPPPMTTASLCRSDQIHQASCGGLKVDRMHEQPFLLQSQGGVVNAAAGRPLDSIPAGEWGAMTETGMRITLDSYMAQLGADEGTGVFAFYHDQLLRVCGVNLHMFDSTHEYEGLDDGGEAYSIRGQATYLWEALGLAEIGDDPYKERDADVTQISEPHYSKLEPSEDDQQPFHRLRTFHGYLGQGSLTSLSGKSPGLSRYDGDDVLDGLFEESTGLDGSYSLRSAKRITLAKRPAIPVPKRVRRPEDKDGDNSDNYKASGVYGGGGVHKVRDRILNELGFAPGAAGSPRCLQTATGVLDVHAHLFNWNNLHPFHYHENDWFLPEEDATNVGTNTGTLPFGSLGSAFYLPDADTTYVDVDHRYGGTSVYQNYSYFDMLDDGGVVIGDGFGAEIRMTGGHLFLTAPGDVWLQPGRNVNVMGGRDVIVKAKNSIDISATDTDVRIKAEKNLHMIGGNDGDTGGVLIESPTPSVHVFDSVKGEDVVHGGITLKAKKGFVTTWASNIYLRTGGGDVETGSITLDANKGGDPIYMRSSHLMKYVQTLDGTYFETGDKVGHANVQFLSGQVWGQGHSTIGYHVLDGFMVTRGGISVVDGHIATTIADTDKKGIYVWPLKDESLTQAIEALDDAQRAEDDSVATADTTLEAQFTNYLYAENQVGNEDVIRHTEFTHRTVEQYRTVDFRLWESRWQHLARTMGSGGSPWVEKESHKEEFPYPGKDKLKTDEVFVQQDLLLFDGGVSKSRTGSLADYEEPEFKEPVCKKMNDAFLVIT
jgi:hypothetical protein